LSRPFTDSGLLFAFIAGSPSFRNGAAA